LGQLLFNFPKFIAPDECLEIGLTTFVLSLFELLIDQVAGDLRSPDLPFGPAERDVDEMLDLILKAAQSHSQGDNAVNSSDFSPSATGTNYSPSSVQ
jgi:hypothetical protein